MWINIRYRCIRFYKYIKIIWLNQINYNGFKLNANLINNVVDLIKILFQLKCFGWIGGDLAIGIAFFAVFINYFRCSVLFSSMRWRIEYCIEFRCAREGGLLAVKFGSDWTHTKAGIFFSLSLSSIYNYDIFFTFRWKLIQFA